MTCKEVFNRLYDTLNSGVENLTADALAKHYELCQTCCEFCRFDAQVIKAMQDSHLREKPASDLRSRIIREIDSST